LLVLSVGLAACGSDPKSSGKSDQEKFEEAALKHAQCLREHGVQASDPQPGKGFQVVGKPGDDMNKLKRAEDACKHFIDDVPPPKVDAGQQAEMTDRALKFSQCMRAHGVPDFPDPQIESGGRMTMKLPKSIGPDNPRVQAAQKACASVGPQIGGASPTPGGGPVFGTGPGPSKSGE
jgi:hypothetical protein